MVSLKVENGKFIGIDDQKAPVPHSLTRVVKVSGNYGLADKARRDFQELALKEGELPVPVMANRRGRSTGSTAVDRNEEKTVVTVGGRGRGRGRLAKLAPVNEDESETKVKNTSEWKRFQEDDEDESGSDEASAPRQLKNINAGHSPSYMITPANARGPDYQDICRLFLKGVEDPFEKDSDAFGNDKEEQVLASVARSVQENPSTMERYVTVTASIPSGSFENTQTIARKAGKTSGAMKTNGYILFVRHKGKQTGTTGTISDLMRIFDNDWKMLPEQQKQVWKIRAKTNWKHTFGSGENQARQGDGRERKLSSSSATSTTTTTTTTGTRQQEDSDEGY